MKRYLGYAIASLVSFLLETGSVRAISLRTVALSDDSAPGGGVFSDLNAPLLNERGQTAFLGTAGGMGIWSEGYGRLSLVVKEGDLTGPPGGIFSQLAISTSPQLVLNDEGHVAFGATVSRQTRGIWQSTSSGLSVLFREGHTTLQGSDETLSFDRFEGIAFNNSNDVLFAATTPVEAGYDDVLVKASVGGAHVVAREGMVAPGLPSSARFGSFIFGNTIPHPINDQPHAAFRAAATTRTGIWAEGSGGLHLVAAPNQAAPGFPSGRRFAGFSVPSLNDAGHTLFFATVEFDGPDVDGIWSDRGGGLELIAKPGDPVPGIAGATFERLWLSTASPVPVINHFDRLAFAGRMNGNFGELNNTALFSDAFGSLRIVAQEGDQVPDAPAGRVFSDFLDCQYSIHCGYAMNGNGQVAFLDPFRGLFAQDVHGELHSIVQIGNPLEVAPGDVRIVSRVNFRSGSGNEDGRPSAFNDKGQIAFRAEFVDGSFGVFVSNVVAIPEPSTFGLAGMSLLGTLIVRSWLFRKAPPQFN